MELLNLYFYFVFNIETKEYFSYSITLHMGLIGFLIVGAISGWLAGQFWKGSGFGLLGNLIVGIIGGLVGGWLAGKLGFFGNGMIYRIVVSAGGAWLLLYLLSLVNKEK